MAQFAALIAARKSEILVEPGDDRLNFLSLCECSIDGVEDVVEHEICRHKNALRPMGIDNVDMTAKRMYTS